MKKPFTILLITLMLFSLSSCEESKSYENGYSDGYEEGYFIGYEAGADEGIENALDYVSNALNDELWNLERDTAEKYGLHPDEAASVLDAFMNGEFVSEEELQIAIDSICGYYYDSFDLPNTIEDMYLYID